MPNYNLNQPLQQFQNAPPDIQTGALDVFQRQQLAKMLMQRGIENDTPNQYTPTGGGHWAAPPQMINDGLAKGLTGLGEAGIGKYMQNKANSDQQALADRLRAQQSQEVSDYVQAGQPTPEQLMGPPTEDGQMGIQEAKPANPMAQALLGLNSTNPTLNKLGEHQLTNQIDQSNALNMLDSIQKRYPQQPHHQPLTELTGDELPTKGAFKGDIQGLRQSINAIPDPTDRAAALAQLEEQIKSAQPKPERVLMGIPRAQAAAMELSGNKVLMAQGKQVMDAYKAADLEDLVKNPNRQAAATQAQAATAGNVATVEAGKDRRALKISSWGDVSKVGQDYFDALPPDKQTAVNMLTSYELDPKTFSVRSGERAAAVTAAKIVDPNFNPMKYGIRYGVVQDFTKGKTAENIVAIDQAVNHMGTLGELFTKVKTGDMQGANYVVNAVSKQFGDPNITNVQLASQAVGEELMRVFRQVGASEREAREWEEKFKASKSPEQMFGAIQTASKLLDGRINALNNRWNNGMDVKTGYPNILSDEARSVLSNYGITKSSNKISPTNVTPTAVPKTPSAPAMSLEDYLKKKEGT